MSRARNRKVALDKILKLKRQWERQVSLDYLMNEKFVQFAAVSYTHLDVYKRQILTRTERLMMGNRPKNPANARNKNVLVVGGSGSGKTRFWLKPNLLQCHSSYAVSYTHLDVYKRQGQYAAQVHFLYGRAKQNP